MAKGRDAASDAITVSLKEEVEILARKVRTVN